jgi:hypothetical protein
MSVGPVWSKGNAGQYTELEDLFNAAKAASTDGLADFAEALRQDGDANVICEQIRLLDTISEAEAIRAYYSRFKSAADNWFGDDGRPMWSRHTKTRPAEMHRVICEAEAYLADLLIAGAERCQFFGQCKHHDFEMWLTWPPYGFVGEEVRVWLFSGNDYLYTEDAYAGGAPLAVTPKRDPDGELANTVALGVAAANDDLVAAYRGLRDGLDDPSLSPSVFRDLDEAVQAAQGKLINTAAGHPDLDFPAFKGTALAIASDVGLPVLGDISIQYLEDFLADPREPRLNQPPEAMLSPAGAPAAGVRFRWDRTRPGYWPPYRPLNTCLEEYEDLAARLGIRA